MTNRRVQSKDTDLAQVVRLVDAKRSRKEATPIDDGIRPTREGPWDPCRYQEYEISPEFRRQIMSAQLPHVDPAIFAETMPTTRVDDVLAQDAASEQQSSRSEPNAAAQASPASKLPSTRSRRALIRTLVIAGACFGLMIGSWASLSRKGSSRPAITSVQVPRLLPACAPSTVALPRLAALPVHESPATPPPATPPPATVTTEHNNETALRNVGLPSAPSAVISVSPTVKRAVPQAKRAQHAPPAESFPLVEVD